MFKSSSFVCITSVFFSLVLAVCTANSEVLKRRLALSEDVDAVLPHTTSFYFSKLKEAAASVIDELQPEINADNKDDQLTTRLYMKRIDQHFFATPQGKLFKKTPLDTNNATKTAQILDVYMTAVWNATKDLQRRMALDDGQINLKYAIPPVVVQRIFRKYSTAEYSAKIVALSNSRSNQNTPSDAEIVDLRQISYDRSPLIKFTSIHNDEFKYYSVLTAKMSCLQCHGEKKGDIDAYFFKKEGYSYNQKIGSFIFTFKAVNSSSDTK